MNKKQNEAREKLERLCNSLADDIDAMSDDELLAELKEAGEDADAIATRTGALIADAVASIGREAHQRALKDCKQCYPVLTTQNFEAADGFREERVAYWLAALQAGYWK